jgi:hypothetical protein
LVGTAALNNIYNAKEKCRSAKPFPILAVNLAPQFLPQTKPRSTYLAAISAKKVARPAHMPKPICGGKYH